MLWSVFKSIKVALLSHGLQIFKDTYALVKKLYSLILNSDYVKLEGSADLPLPQDIDQVYFISKSIPSSIVGFQAETFLEKERKKIHDFKMKSLKNL